MRWIRLQPKKLRDALDGYINKARKVSGKRSTSRKVGSAVDLKPDLGHVCALVAVIVLLAR